ncbi:MAG: 50S ribosomal protein L22 [Alphaproteobacteria bacterium]|nr:50S ribosomal protein L22 [Alphaproteobacteria bacterium]
MSKPKSPRPVADNEAMAVARNIRTSPRKLNLVAGLIRGKNVSTALDILAFNNRRMAAEVRKVLQSAIANAQNNHQLNPDDLVVKEASVGTGLVMKRFHARAKGRGAKILKPFAHLRVVVKEQTMVNQGE